MRLESIWSDIYGSTLALYTGRAGGTRWLVTCAPRAASAALEGLARLQGKGSVLLLGRTGPTALQAVLEEQQNPARGRGLAGVLVLERDLSGGPALSVPVRTVQVESSGLEYREGGEFPAWQDALTLSQLQPEGECVAASVCAGLGLPVRVCAPERLEAVFQEWWAAGGARAGDFSGSATTTSAD